MAAHFSYQMAYRYGKFFTMKATVQMDSAGRLVLPKKIRERLRLHTGDRLILEVSGDTIQLQPQQAKAQLKRVNGVLVLVTETPIPEGRDLVAESRDDRIEDLARKWVKHE